MSDEPDAAVAGTCQKFSRFERQTRKRDKLEIGACVIGVAVFAWAAFDEPSALSKVGAFLLAGLCCVGLVLRCPRTGSAFSAWGPVV